MTYHLGVDLGTTFTAAAVARDGRAEPVTLSSNNVAVPSVVCVEGDDFLVGQPAARRAITEPSRVAREFKRRVGDPTPLLLDGSPVPAELLMARLLAWVVKEVSSTEGQPPASLAVTHPANWGEYKLDLFRQAIRQVGLQADHLVSEPVAAATFYASQRDLAPGSIVAVYDLGGGTFDAALVRAEPTGLQIIGRPDGVERLGGIDFDHAVFRHATEAVGIDLDNEDTQDTGMAAALNQLRQQCVEAKEALSSDTDVSIPVMVPNRHTQVRLTRSELERMVSPALDETLVALRRTISSAGITAEQVAAVLLVGGSSRIPLVSERVMAELGRPIAVDARPKDAIPLGAALVASRAASAQAPVSPSWPQGPAPVPVPVPPGSTQPAPSPSPQPQPAPMGGTPGSGSPVPPMVPQPVARSSNAWAWWVSAGIVAVTIVLVAVLVANSGGGGDEEPTVATGSTTTTADDTTTTEAQTTTTTGDVPEVLAPLFEERTWEETWTAGERLPGDSWNSAARDVIIEECDPSFEPILVDTDKTIAEYCDCVYDELTQRVDFDVYNEGQTSVDFPGLDHPALVAMLDGLLICYED